MYIQKPTRWTKVNTMELIYNILVNKHTGFTIDPRQVLPISDKLEEIRIANDEDPDYQFVLKTVIDLLHVYWCWLILKNRPNDQQYTQVQARFYVDVYDDDWSVFYEAYNKKMERLIAEANNFTG